MAFQYVTAIAHDKREVSLSWAVILTDIVSRDMVEYAVLYDPTWETVLIHLSQVVCRM